MSFVREFQTCSPEGTKYFYEHIKNLPEESWITSKTLNQEVQHNSWRTSRELAPGSLDPGILDEMSNTAANSGRQYRHILSRECVELSFEEIFTHNPPAYEPLTIIRYNPGEYYDWHLDRRVVGLGWDPSGCSMITRGASYIWYLNDDFKGGETDIAGYGKVKPEAGKCVVFPSNEYFPHTGCEVKDGTKYIAVTWFLNRTSLHQSILAQMKNLVEHTGI